LNTPEQTECRRSIGKAASSSGSSPPRYADPRTSSTCFPVRVRPAPVGDDQTGSESLTIEAGDKVLPNLSSDVVGNTLVLGPKRGAVLPPGARISYRLSVKDLTGLTVSGSGEVAAPKITTDALTSDISGSGTITVGGSAPEQQLKISGSGSYEAGGLAGQTLRADISGSGHAVVSVSDTLEVSISGSGSLTYSGDPTVHKDISGSGSVTKK
jgi:hypothetical protein